MVGKVTNVSKGTWRARSAAPGTDAEPDRRPAAALAGWLQANAPWLSATAAAPIAATAAFDTVEAAAVQRAMAARRHEFHTGRRLAREALARLGCPPATMAVDDDRVPLWPAGYTGSISHGGGLCIAHVARRTDCLGVGIDLEPDQPLPAEVAALVCRDDEAGAPEAALLRFVAKEAFYKAYFPAARRFLEFGDVRIAFAPDLCFQAALVEPDIPGVAGQRVFSGRLARLGGHLLAACWISA